MLNSACIVVRREVSKVYIERVLQFKTNTNK